MTTVMSNNGGQISRCRRSWCGALLVVLVFGSAWASDSFETRVSSLSKSNDSFAAAGKILSKSEINTPEELKQAIGLLSKALESEKNGPDRSVIYATSAGVYLMGLRDCNRAKQYSSAAVASDPNSDYALNIDISTDMCIAGITENYDPIVGRLEKLVKEDRHFKSLYSLLGLAYMYKSNRTNSSSDLIRAKEAFLKAKAKNEPEASPGALDDTIRLLEGRLHGVKRN